MISCIFEDGGRGLLRHVTLDAIVEKDTKLLLILRASRLLEGNKWGLPGGYLNRDETAQVGISREVLEETGYTVTGSTLFMINSQPNRPKEDRQNVNLTFIATIGDKVGSPDDEVQQVKWFSPDELPASSDFAFDHDMIVRRYFEYKQKKLQLPLFI